MIKLFINYGLIQNTLIFLDDLPNKLRSIEEVVDKLSPILNVKNEIFFQNLIIK